jgi:hypothetical protein
MRGCWTLSRSPGRRRRVLPSPTLRRGRSHSSSGALCNDAAPRGDRGLQHGREWPDPAGRAVHQGCVVQSSAAAARRKPSPSEPAAARAAPGRHRAVRHPHAELVMLVQVHARWPTQPRRPAPDEPRTQMSPRPAPTPGHGGTARPRRSPVPPDRHHAATTQPRSRLSGPRCAARHRKRAVRVAGGCATARLGTPRCSNRSHSARSARSEWPKSRQTASATPQRTR